MGKARQEAMMPTLECFTALLSLLPSEPKDQARFSHEEKKMTLHFQTPKKPPKAPRETEKWIFYI